MNNKLLKTFNKAIVAGAITCALATSTMVLAETTADHNKQIIGYITNWDPWKDTKAGFPAKGVANHLNVDMSKFTVLNYSFFGVARDGSLHSGDLRNKNIYKPAETQAPGELLMSDIFSSWDYHLIFGELAASYELTDEAKAQGFTATGQSWQHEAFGLSGAFPIPVHKTGGKPGLLEHAHANGVKVMASIGGWSMSKHFSEMAADATKRANFIKDVRRLMAIGFDGIDLDWEYPGPYEGMNFKGTEADYPNFLTLVKEIRAEIGADKLITAAFSADHRKLEGFDWPELEKYMDHFNMMTYDFNGGWSTIAGHNSPVYDYTGAEVPFFNWHTLAQWMTDKGIDRNKINMGIPFYGRGVVTETPADLNANTIKQAITIQPDGPISTAADFTHWKQEVYDGTPNHFYIEQNRAGWDKKYDAEAMTPYLTKTENGKSYFTSYDDVDSVGKKAQYVNDYSLGGAIVWTVVGDLQCTGGVTVHSGKLASCGTVNQPLANKINEVFATGCQGCPTIFFTSPNANEQHAPGDDINLAVNASDADGTIAQVSFSVNGQQIAVDTTAPFAYNWQNVALGEYKVIATAVDNQGNSKETPAMNVLVNEDHLKPTVSYTGPSGDLMMDPLAPIVLSANAQYQAGTISAVEFVVNNEVLTGTMAGSGQYSATYNPVNYGLHNVTINATNSLGYSQMTSGEFNLTLCTGDQWNASTIYTTEQVIYSNKLYQSKWWNQNARPDAGGPWNFVKDCSGSDKPNQKPVISDLAPSGQTFDLNSDVRISANATDSDGSVSKVDFYINNALLVSDTSAPYDANYVAKDAGNFVLKAVATDNLGATSEAQSSFSVSAGTDVIPPTVTITNPGSGIEYAEGEVLTLSASANDVDGAVVSVEFILDGTSVNLDTTEPYTNQWTAAGSGSHTLTAKATDNEGYTGSQSVTFTVKSSTTSNCKANAWTASTVYNGGDRASVGEMVYEARWWTQGEDPTKGTDQWYVWYIPADCQ